MLDANETQTFLPEGPQLAMAGQPRQPLGWRDWLGWFGLSAGATMLVGAIALWAAMRETPKPFVNVAPSICPTVCPTAIPVEAAPPKAESHPAPAAKPASRSRPSVHRRPDGPEVLATKCDGRDPLCGIDLGAIDDIGKKPVRGGGR